MNAWRCGSPVPAIGNSTAPPPDPSVVFNRLSGRLRKDGIHADHYASLYGKAWMFKRVCVEFYSGFMKRFTANRRDTLINIIDQERNHAIFFRNIIEFLKQPRELVGASGTR
jgi:hypothetical protein